MYHAAMTGVKERRPSVIMAWGYRPWLSQTSKHERLCVLKATGASNSLRLRSCMLPSFLAKQATTRMDQKTKKRTQPQNKERKAARQSRASTVCLARTLVKEGNATPSGQRVQLLHLPHMAAVPLSGYGWQYLDYLPGPAAVCK